MLLIFAGLALLLTALSFIHTLSWLSFIGLTLSIAVWVVARKGRQYSTLRYGAAALGLGIGTTFVALFSVLYSFVWGSLMYGGSLLY